MIDSIFSNPLFGICITLTAYAIGVAIYSRVKISILHPVLIASGLILASILMFNIPLDSYQNGGSMISFMLGPATVALALPLYRQLNVLKKHAAVILISIAVGSIVSIISSTLLAKALGLPEELILSIIPKSVTTPIAVEVSEKIGGHPPVTALAVIFTGIVGAVIGPWIMKTLRIKDAAAKGLAMGTSAHAIGTARALELGETEGALSSLSIGLAGIITAVTAPILAAALI